MLYMGSALMIGGTIELLEGRNGHSRAAIIALCVGAVTACGATVIGVLWAGAIALFVLLYWLLVRRETLATLFGISYGAPALAVVGIALLLVHSVRMFAQGKLPALMDGNVLSLAFSLYANAGFLGIGPGMLDLRDFGASALLPYAWSIAVATVVLGSLAAVGIVTVYGRAGRYAFALAVGCLMLPVIGLLLLSAYLKWRILPRHFIPLVALISYIYAFGLIRSLNGNLMGRGLAILAITVMAYSAFSARLAARHQKEDYRQAALTANRELASGARVWWIADFRGALYYAVPFENYSAPGVAASRPDGATVFVGDRTAAEIAQWARPALVVLSRPESYDRSGVVRAFLERQNYRRVGAVRGFTLWRPVGLP
jgi:hypothetical protein